ncbi:MAG: metal-binding protein [Synechococcales cyanobacterium]
MPLGKTHDRITLWTLPLVTAGAGWVGGADIALAVGGSYLFAGLMFAGDLDTYSRQYQRWLWVRWLWIPYQKLVRHRSIWSHGLVVGTVVRLLYLGLWGAALLGIVWAVRVGVGHGVGPVAWSTLQETLIYHRAPLLGILVGLELGSLSHSCSDWLGSAWKRRRRPK